MDFGVVLVVAIVFIGLPAVVMNGIIGFRKQGMSKKQLELEKEKLELERQKLRILELQAENKLLDRHLERQFDREGFN